MKSLFIDFEGFLLYPSFHIHAFFGYSCNIKILFDFITLACFFS